MQQSNTSVRLATDVEQPIADDAIVDGRKTGAKQVNAAETSASIVVASTFVADLVIRPIEFWMQTLSVRADVSMAPYAQIMQQLLDPASLLSANSGGFNVLLVRLEDWIRDRMQAGPEENLRHLRSTAGEFARALEISCRRCNASTSIFFCPSSSRLPHEYSDSIGEIQRELVGRLELLANVQCLSHQDLCTLYPVVDYEDADTDRIGHIPYSGDYFVAIGTLLARRMAVRIKPRYKVIAVDCDNTLWKGVCGEDGHSGVELTAAHLQLQAALVKQFEAGMLLCLCSKNNPADVEAVFRNRSDMVLREEHLICSRVNWNSKSSNLESLSQELDLALDSFIFIDDSALECAEVNSRCPSVLALRLPETSEGISHFLQHVWAFDHVAATDESRQRTARYRENRARSVAMKQVSDIDAFLASLDLRVEISELRGSDLSRVEELVQRTNQFNLTGIRRRSAEIQTLLETGELDGLVVRVRDRFGDYGLVGALLFRRESTAIVVDTFVLSCRVLGRKVEHEIVNELARLGSANGLSNIVLTCHPTARNVPAREFLERSFASFRRSAQAASDGIGAIVYAVPVEQAATVRNDSERSSTAAYEASAVEPVSAPRPALASSRWHDAAHRLSRLDDIIDAINSSSRRRTEPTTSATPKTALETALAGVWSTVLGLENVSIHEDFFEVGGDSLQAVQLVAAVGSILGLRLTLGDFFSGPTIAALATRLADADQFGQSVVLADRMQPLLLSSAQQRLWFIDRLERGSAAYHIPLVLRLCGDLDGAVLIRALDALVERHESLRSVFEEMEGEPVHRTVSSMGFPLQHVDLSAQRIGNLDAEIVRQAQEEMTACFDLGSGPLIRGRLLRLAQDDHALLITVHHIVSDGWSNAVLIRELGSLYRAFREGSENPLVDLPIQYPDYARWQRGYLSTRHAGQQLSYWTAHLQGAPQVIELPTDRRRPPVQSYRGSSVAVSIDAALAADLRVLSRRFNLTLAMTLYSAWAIVLSRLSGQDDIVIGMPVANRPRTEFEGLVGLFVNTLAVRVRLDGEPSVYELLQRVKTTMLAAYAHQDVPFEEVVKELHPPRSLSHSPVFQVMLALQTPSAGEIQLPELCMTEQEIPLPTAQFDLLLSLRESAGAISGSLNYASDLFDATTVQRWIGHLQAVLQAMVHQPRQAIDGIALMSNAERLRVLQQFNSTQAAYPQSKLIHQLFEERVEVVADAVAVTFEGESLSYAALNARANQLARYLRERGVGPEQLVGICIERSVEMVVGLLGVLKAGGAYVPLDPDHPAERLRYMLDTARPRVLLTQQHLIGKLSGMAEEVLPLDSAWNVIDAFRKENLDARAIGLTSRNLAYVIFTSGSTGQPKGAMNEHRALINRLLWMQNEYRLDRSDAVLQKTPFSFDVSVWEFFWTLSTGARLVIARPQGHQDPTYLADLIERAQISTLHFVPSMLQVFLDQHQAGQCMGIRHIICSGEELSVTLQNRCLSALPHAKLSNLYGPTEAAIDVTAWECRLDEKADRVPIGRPIWNTQMYVVDRRGEPVPIGVAGEILIGGVGVGRGYLDRAELTAERFAQNPFAADGDSRIYRTGDVGRWRPDGAIEYLGRNDHQVKIRGLRIELGEIETQLLRHVNVKEAVVTARQSDAGDKRLVAYVVLREANSSAAESLRAYLRSALPDYMVPSAFVRLDSLPLSPNGKLDRRALPAPGLDSYVTRHYEAPTGVVEERLAGIWRTLLRVERIGRHDNFFELGGHSLLIMQMMEQLRRAGLSTQVRSVFESPTLAGLAAQLGEAKAVEAAWPRNLIPDACAAITPRMLTLVELNAEQIARVVAAVPGGAQNIQDVYPLAPSQEGILFHHLLAARKGDTYVLPMVLQVRSRQRLEELIAALQAAIDRHDVLRSAVLWEELPRPVQVVLRKAQLVVEDAPAGTDADALDRTGTWLTSAYQRIDLGQAPLMRLQVAPDTSGAGYEVLLQLHHIAIDHVTLELLISEVVTRLQGRTQVLAPSEPYRNHVARSLAYAAKNDASRFFRSKLADIDEPTAAFGVLDVHSDSNKLEEAQLAVESELATRLRSRARRLGVSTATLFHAAWGLVVAHTSGRDDVVFGSVLLGRLQGGAGMHRTLGMFVNTLPIRLQLEGRSALGLIEHAQGELADLLIHEQASLVEAQRCSGLTGSTPLFNTLFNYRHTARNVAEEWALAEGVRLVGIRDWTNYPIMASVDDLGDGFLLTAQTDRRIDAQRITGYLHMSLRSLLEALENEPQAPALSLSILPATERHQVLEHFNATHAPYARDRLVHELFEQQVQAARHLPAVTFGGRSLSYGELNARANRLARHLKSHGVGADQPVGICVERGLEMVVGLLGILKAGGAYVPLDPAYPRERLQYMLMDAAPRVVLTQEKLKLQMTGRPGSELISLDADLDATAGYSDHDLPSDGQLTSGNLLYLIYTSGSTGKPKGTAMSHGAMVNLIEWHRRTFGMSAGKRVLQFAALSFDVAFQETFSTLCTGGTLVLLNEWVRKDPRALLDLLRNESIERLFVPPLVLQSLAESCGASKTMPSALRDVITAGEQLRISPEIKAFFERIAGCRLHNHYGPTETHVVTALTLTGSPVDWPTIPTIGRPIANSRIYILDARRQPSPRGVEGEIYIAGAGLARGYLGQPVLTAERFVADPFDGDSTARMYKTGDVGRWSADGTVEYLGRNDDQVKIRGYRIELGEIEARLMLHSQVKEAAVISRSDPAGDRRLVAYVTLSNPQSGPPEELQEHVKAALPEFMVPAAFVILDRLPLTPSGKLDRQSLPAPQVDANATRQYEAPEGEVEQALAEIWQELLQVERIGRNDDFFELGGHSLLAMRLVARIQFSLIVAVPIASLFEAPTLKQLAAHVDALRSERLVFSIEDDDSGIADLLETLSSMPESKAQELLREIRMEEAP